MTEDEIQQVRLQFIRELQQDKVLSIESLLSTIPKSERSSLQADLLKIELEHRLKAGEDVSAEAYLKRYPDHEALIKEAFDEAKEGLALAETVLSDGRPVVKVIDFGLAKALADPRILSQRDHFTQIGQVIGTFEYMSPEQADLTRVDVDARTDVYSLGVLFYELLTGSTPLIRSRIRNVPFDEVLSLIREEDAPRLSQRVKPSDPSALAICERRQTEPRKLARMLTGDIERIAAKALQKECTLRYAGPADLVAGGIVSVALLIATVGFVLQHREKQRAAAAVALRDKRILYRDSVIETQNQVTLIALAQSPRYHEAVEAIDAMLLEPRASPDLKYNAACVYSRAGEFLQSTTGTLYSKDVEILLKTSCDLLLKLARNGYFSDGDQVTNLLTDPDIAAARKRPEFDIIIEETARRRQSAP